MSELESILRRYPVAVCPVDDTAQALDALAALMIHLRPLVALTTPDGKMLSGSFDGTQPTLVLHSAPVTSDTYKDALNVRWLW